MAFNISDFNSQISKRGLARSNVFVVRLVRLPETLADQISARELTFFCKTVDIPSMGFETVEGFPYGFGQTVTKPTGMSLPPISSIFMLDSNHDILKFFHKWIQSVVNYDMSQGVFSQVDDMLPHEIAYKDEYVGTMEVHFFSENNDNKYYTYIFDNVYPTELGSIGLSWESNDEIATLPVSFAYDSIKVDGSRSGTIPNTLNRGTSLMNYIETLNGYVSVINGIGKPRSIQDTVNRFANGIVERIF